MSASPTAAPGPQAEIRLKNGVVLSYPILQATQEHELKLYCQELGLSAEGLKADLQDRLNTHILPRTGNLSPSPVPSAPLAPSSLLEAPPTAPVPSEFQLQQLLASVLALDRGGLPGAQFAHSPPSVLQPLSALPQGGDSLNALRRALGALPLASSAGMSPASVHAPPVLPQAAAYAPPVARPGGGSSHLLRAAFSAPPDANGAPYDEPEDGAAPEDLRVDHRITEECRHSTSGNASSYLQGQRISQQRNHFELVAWAAAIDALNRGETADVLEMAYRRFAGILLADRAGNWDICRALEWPYHNSNIVSLATLNTVRHTNARRKVWSASAPRRGASATSSSATRNKPRRGAGSTKAGAARD